MPDALTDKSPYLQCRCNQLSPHGTCHLKPISSNVGALIGKCSSLFSVFLWPKMLFFTPKNKKDRKFMNSIFGRKINAEKNAFFGAENEK